MKKIIAFIVGAGMFIFLLSYIYINRYVEETEIINPDVSINDIKCILSIVNEVNSDIQQIPIGYKDGKIYFMKYNVQTEEYDNIIYTLNGTGNEEKSKIEFPEKFCKDNLSILGEKIFFSNGYFNITTGKERILFDNTKYDDCYSVSGNNNFVLFKKNENSKNEYSLYDLENDKTYSFICEENSEDSICNIVYDEAKKEFYAICMDNTLKKVKFKNLEFILEKYCELKNNLNDLKVCESGYTFESKGQLFFTTNKNDNGTFNIEQININNKYLERVDNIGLRAYDKYFREYTLLEKSDDKNNNKLYFARFKYNGFEMLMEVPRIGGKESDLTIHMIDSDNVLVHEEIQDKSTEKIKNVYKVYDLMKYFEESNSEDKTEAWNYDDNVTLNNAFRSINKYEENIENKNKITDDDKDNDIIEDQNNLKEKVNTQDYRENSSSWKKGNESWYYYDDEDELVTGWVHTPKGWYYFFTDGVMQKNTIVCENGEEYYLGDDGLLINTEDNIEKNLEKYYDEDKKIKVGNTENKLNINSEGEEQFKKNEGIEENLEKYYEEDKKTEVGNSENILNINSDGEEQAKIDEEIEENKSQDRAEDNKEK